MIRYKNFYKATKNSRLIYLFAMISMVISQMINALLPIILWSSVDSIIGDEPFKFKLIKKIVDLFGGKLYIRNHIYIIALFIVIISAIGGLFVFLKTVFANIATERIAKNLRDDIYTHLEFINYKYISKTSPGDIIQRSTSDIETIKRLLSLQFVEILSSISIFTFSLIIMFILNVKVALICAFGCFIIGSVSYLFYSNVKKLFMKLDEAEAKLTHTVSENVSHIRVIKAFNREKFHYDLFKIDNENLKKRQFNFSVLNAVYWSVTNLTTFLLMGSVIGYGGYLAIKNVISFGDLAAFTSYVNLMIWPIRSLTRILADSGKATVAIKRIEEILQFPEEDMISGIKKVNIKGGVRFENVGFKYDTSDDFSIRNISFEIKPDQVLGITGTTGSGKTTLVSLILRLFEPTEGTIYLDGYNIKDLNKEFLRENIAIVLQEPYLYNISIKDNIMITNDTATDKMVVDAAKTANVHKDIMSFEEGYNTISGEGGVNLSGGQKQRIAIARAILKSTPLLILDDSLSAVDMKTDKNIRNALNTMPNKPTLIIISNRLASLVQADLILVLEKGNIIQKGTHEELIREEGFYKNIFEIQNN